MGNIISGDLNAIKSQASIVLLVDASGNALAFPSGGNIGNVTGPLSSTDQGIARWSGTGGLVIENSLVTISDAGFILPSGSGTQDVGSATLPFRHIFALDVTSPSGAFVLLGGDTMTGGLSGTSANFQSITGSTINVGGGGILAISGTNTSNQTDIFVNPATKTAGNFIDTQVGSVSKFSVRQDGVTSTSSEFRVVGGTAVTSQGLRFAINATGQLGGVNGQGTIVADASAEIDLAGISGTSNAGSIMFYAGNQFVTQQPEVMRINSSGNVGIGTVLPAGVFQVNQVPSGLGSISSAVGGTLVTGVGTQFLNTFKINDTITANGETRTISAIANNTGLTTDAWVGANTGINYSLVGGNRLTALGNGYVGIGNTTPLDYMHIKPTTNAQGLTIEYGSGTPQITLSGNSSSTNDILFLNNVQPLDGRLRYDNATHAFKFFTNNASRLIIDASGNTLIGAPAPGVGIPSAQFVVSGNGAAPQLPTAAFFPINSTVPTFLISGTQVSGTVAVFGGSLSAQTLTVQKSGANTITFNDTNNATRIVALQLVTAGGGWTILQSGNNMYFQDTGGKNTMTFIRGGQNPYINLIDSTVNTFTQSAGQGTAISITPTYTNSGTSAQTDLLINRTESTIGSGNQLLLDTQIGGTSKFNVDHSGNAYLANSLAIGTPLIYSGLGTTLTVSGNTAGTPLLSVIANLGTGTTLLVSGVTVLIGSGTASTTSAMTITQVTGGGALTVKNGAGTIVFSQQGTNLNVNSSAGNTTAQIAGAINAGFLLGSGASMSWDPAAALGGNGDTGLSRGASGTVYVGAGAALNINNASGTLVAKNVAATMYNPNLFSPLPEQTARTIYQITPSTATTVTTYGGPPAVTSGTLTQPAWSLSTGWMQNYATASGAGAMAGALCGSGMFARVTGGAASAALGFNFNCRFALPDITYGTPSGVRIFIGMTDQVSSVPVSADNFAGNYIGLQFCTASGSARQDTNFVIMSKDNTTQNSGTTTIAPATNGMYDLFINCPVTSGISTAFWQLKNITSQTVTASSGSITTNLPLVNTPLQPYFGIATWSSGIIPAGAIHNIMTPNIYVETAA